MGLQSMWSNKFYQTNNPATRETADGVWTYMPYGSHVPPPPDGHQASTSANRRRRRRRKHGDSGPGPGGDAWSERGEEETPTEDPSVIPSWHSDHHGSVDRVARTSPTTVTNQRHARKIPSSADDATDLRAYNKFCKKVEIWMLQVAPYLSKREAALSLYNALQGEAEQELEHTPVSEIYTDDGVQVILQALKAPMEQKAIYQKRRYLNDFEHIRRYQGETMRSFVNRFRRVQRSLRSVGINIEAAYDSESMGSRLLDRSGLTHEQQRMILVATSQSLLFESVAEALTLQFQSFVALLQFLVEKMVREKARTSLWVALHHPVCHPHRPPLLPPLGRALFRACVELQHVEPSLQLTMLEMINKKMMSSSTPLRKNSKMIRMSPMTIKMIVKKMMDLKMTVKARMTFKSWHPS